MAADLAAIAE
jgi:hypothetical protein